MNGPLQHLLNQFATFRKSQSGASTIEYGLVASFIAIALVASLSIYGDGVSGFYTGLTSLVTDPWS